jgi:YVTN family beta-propeller protein
MKRLVVVLLPFLVPGWLAATQSGGEPFQVPGARAALQSGSARLYVTNQDDATISVIDVASRRLLETVDLLKLGFSPTAKPHHAQVEPDGRFWYVTLIGAGKVLKFDRENRIVGSVDLEVPGLMALHPTQDLLLVARSMSAVNPPKRMALIRRSDMKLLDEVDVFFPRPHAIAIHPAGSYAYVASLGVNQLASVRLEDGQLSLIDVEGPQHTFTQFSLSPDGKWLVLTASQSHQLMVFDLADPARPTLARTVPQEKGPFETAFSRDGRWLVVSNLDANAVTVVDAAQWQPVQVIKHPQFAQPHGVVFSPDGAWAFVSNRHQAGGAHDHEGNKPTGGGVVAAICLADRTVENVIPVGHYAAGMGVATPARAADGPAPPASPAQCH